MEAPSDTLFLGGLPPDVVSEELEKIFNNCVGFVSCRLRKDRNNRSAAHICVLPVLSANLRLLSCQCHELQQPIDMCSAHLCVLLDCVCEGVRAAGSRFSSRFLVCVSFIRTNWQCSLLLLYCLQPSWVLLSSQTTTPQAEQKSSTITTTAEAIH
jgi:RNA recognition motif. (a.k.a. RRM, RBD, or RNP domain)